MRKNNILSFQDKYIENTKIFKTKLGDLQVFDMVRFAITRFYNSINEWGIESPPEWDPIWLYDLVLQYDPYLLSPTQAEELTGTYIEKWQPFPKENAIKRTKKFVQLKKEAIHNTVYDKKTLPHMIKYPHLAYSRYFMYTREVVNNESIIITIMALVEKKIKRILITNIQDLCYEFIRNGLSNRTFIKIIGQASKEEVNSKKRNKITTLIKDGSNIEIQNEHIYEILTQFQNRTIMKHKIISLS